MSRMFNAIKHIFKGGKQKTTGTEVISSVPVSSNVKKKGMAYSTALTRLNESSKRSAQVDKNYKTMKEAKEAFKGAKKDLQNMVDTGRAIKINKKVHRKGVEYDSDALFPTKKKKFNKGGRVGLKSGTQLSAKQMKIASLAGNKKKIDGPDFKKLRAMKSPMDKQVRQKAAFGGGADMGKVASDKTKTEVKKYEKRARDASKFLKNKNRSFGSIMREKYMR